MNPFCIPFAITNMPGALLAMDTGFMGPNYSISTACATGNYCILRWRPSSTLSSSQRYFLVSAAQGEAQGFVPGSRCFSQQVGKLEGILSKTCSVQCGSGDEKWRRKACACMQ